MLLTKLNKMWRYKNTDFAQVREIISKFDSLDNIEFDSYISTLNFTDFTKKFLPETKWFNIFSEKYEKYVGSSRNVSLIDKLHKLHDVFQELFDIIDILKEEIEGCKDDQELNNKKRELEIKENELYKLDDCIMHIENLWMILPESHPDVSLE